MVPFLFGQTGDLFADTGQVSFKFYSVFLIGKKWQLELIWRMTEERLFLLGLILPFLLWQGVA